MRLLVVRHAIAEDPAAFARSHKDDSERPLTPEGRRKMERAAHGLKELVPELDVLAASPYKRAVDTAEIIAGAYGELNVERVPELAPGAGVDRVVGWLAGRHALGNVAVWARARPQSPGVYAARCHERPVPRAPQGRGLPARIPGAGSTRGRRPRLVARAQALAPPRNRAWLDAPTGSSLRAHRAHLPPARRARYRLVT